MIFGTAQRVDDLAEKNARRSHALVEHVVPGRGADARPPTESEMRKTLVVRLPIEEASAKVRTGGPVDDEEDLALDVWAGVVPCRVTFDTPEPAAGVDADVPGYLAGDARDLGHEPDDRLPPHVVVHHVVEQREQVGLHTRVFRDRRNDSRPRPDRRRGRTAHRAALRDSDATL